MRRNLLKIFIILGLLSLAAPGTAAALESADCLGCHSETEAVGTERTIDPARFDHTAHGELGCLACHESVTEQHPEDGLTPSKAVCRDCHQEIAAEYGHTEHAGNATCGDCHNPHAVRSTREVSGVDMNHQCAVCHEPAEMGEAHGVWLPQAGLHLEMLPCVSCHSGSENYVIALYISKRETNQRQGTQQGARPFELAGFDELARLADGRGIASLVDSDGNGLVSLDELVSFNTSPYYRSLRLKGMPTPEVVTHDLRILDNRWDCTFCHASGPGTLQSAVLALPQEDGGYTRLPVEKGAVIEALYGTPDFYMMGSTRNAALNILGLIILAGGLVMPVGHGLLRFLTRHNRL